MLLCVRSLSPLKMISSYFTTLLSNHIDSICKYVPPFPLMTQIQKREGSRFVHQFLHFTLIHLVTDNFSLGIFEKLLFGYNHKKSSKKLSIRKIDFGNVASTTLLKSLSIAVIFLQILQEFKNIFLRKPSKRLLLFTF